MTPKEKANELYFAFSKVLPDVVEIDKNTLKDCVLFAVNLIISTNPHSNPFNTAIYSTIDYWLQVKKEIEQL